MAHPLAGENAVSVIIPTFNRAHLILRSIRSALAVLGPEDEVLVADDGSADGTNADLVCIDPRVRFLPLPHAGAGPTRNAALREATRPLVAFLDSDDEWDADHLHLARTVLERRPEVLFTFTDFRTRDAQGRWFSRYLINWHNDNRPWTEILGPSVPYSQLGELPQGRADFPAHIGNLYPTLFRGYYVSLITMVVRRQQAGDALRFSEDVPMLEDWECFARLSRAGIAAYLDCETATQHGHNSPRLTDTSTERITGARIKVLHRNWGQDPAFLQEHGPHFIDAVREQRLLRARCLIAQGRTSEARGELVQAGEAPASYRFLAALPGFVARGLLRARRLVRGG